MNGDRNIHQKLKKHLILDAITMRQYVLTFNNLKIVTYNLGEGKGAYLTWIGFLLEICCYKKIAISKHPQIIL